MRHFSKLVLLGICIGVLYLYRGELSELLARVGGAEPENTIELTSWAGLRRQANEAYEFKDPAESVTILETYLGAVSEELRRHEYGYENIVTARHDVICELSTIHNKLSTVYYHLSDEDKYYQHQTMYRNYLSQCSQEAEKQND